MERLEPRGAERDIYDLAAWYADMYNTSTNGFHERPPELRVAWALRKALERYDQSGNQRGLTDSQRTRILERIDQLHAEFVARRMAGQ